MVVTEYPRLNSVAALENYLLELRFENGEKKIYDFKPNLIHSFYRELQNPLLFEKVTAVDGEIEWPTGQDFCPHTLYEKSVLA